MRRPEEFVMKPQKLKVTHARDKDNKQTSRDLYGKQKKRQYTNNSGSKSRHFRTKWPEYRTQQVEEENGATSMENQGRCILWSVGKRSGPHAGTRDL
jgi:hypothetical protein